MTVESGLMQHMRPSKIFSNSPRYNPFNHDTSISSEQDDDTLAASSASEITSTTSEGSGDISLAELGLTEDYFSHPEGNFGMSSVEELEAAIENCKKMIIEARENSERQKKLVNKLIQLRMKLQELKEGPTEVEPKVKQVLGHKLRKKTSNSIKYYCDCCNGLIWGMLQAWYRCKDCGFNCHYKCVNMIRRKCIAMDLKTMPYILNISPEAGLSSQQFNCFECKNPISVTGMGREEARLCDYSGQYYCPQCHWNDTCEIPARVLHNWDFTPQKVSRQSYQILSRLYRKPRLNIYDVNPLLFNYVEELADIRKLREDILLMKEYFITCNSALELKLLLKLSDRQHFVDGSHMYSMEDLVQAQDGTLTHDLTTLHAEYAQHIKLDCLYCQAKGFICEICNSGETLFPFDFGVATCSKCKAVFHRDCFTCIDCPRCERLRKKKDIKAAETGSSESEENGFVDQNKHFLSSTDSESSMSDNKQKTSLGEIPAFSTNPAHTSSEKSSLTTRGRTSSSNIKIESSSKKPHDTSLHNLLTESSYTDYAVLGFTGAGKGKNSLPNSRSTASVQGSLSDNLETSANQTDEKQKNAELTSGGHHQRETSKFRSQNKKNFSRIEVVNFENNPITRKAKRDDTMFGDLVGVKGRQRGEIKNGRRRSPFEQTQKAKQIIKNGTAEVKSRSSKEKLPPGRFCNPNLDPFHQNESKGSKFINNVTETDSRLSQGHVVGQTYNDNLDPFNQNETKSSRFVRDAGKVEFNHNQRKHDKPSTTQGQRAVRVQSNLDPFNQETSSGSKFLEDIQRSSHESDFSGKSGGNPFEEDSKNPFDDYDESKNPFS